VVTCRRESLTWSEKPLSADVELANAAAAGGERGLQPDVQMSDGCARSESVPGVLKMNAQIRNNLSGVQSSWCIIIILYHTRYTTGNI